MGYNGGVKFLDLGLNKKQKRWLEFLWTLTEKDLKVRYKFTVLGLLWMIIKPLSQMLVMGFVFQFFVPVKTDNYFVFLFAGLLPWNFFSSTVSRNVTAIVNDRSLIKKAKFPRETIVLSIVLSNFFHFLVSLFLFCFVLFIFGWVNNWHLWFLLPFCLLWLVLLVTALSLLLSALNVRYRDVNFVISIFMQLWFYATPVVYTLDLLPKSLVFLFYLNPMSAVIELFRYSLVGILPCLVNLFSFAIVSTFVFLFLGIIVFRKLSPNFDDWV